MAKARWLDNNLLFPFSFYFFLIVLCFSVSPGSVSLRLCSSACLCSCSLCLWFFIRSQSLPLSVSPGFSLCSALWSADSFPPVLLFRFLLCPLFFSCFSPLCYSSSTPSLFPVFFFLSLLWFLGWFFRQLPPVSVFLPCSLLCVCVLYFYVFLCFF